MCVCVCVCVCVFVRACGSLVESVGAWQTRSTGLRHPSPFEEGAGKRCSELGCVGGHGGNGAVVAVATGTLSTKKPSSSACINAGYRLSHVGFPLTLSPPHFIRTARLA